MLGDCYFALEQYDSAVTAYENALQCNPYHPWEETVHYRIARAHYQQQQYPATISTLHKVIQDTTDYRIYNLLGNALFALGQYVQAARVYETGISMAPPGANIQMMRTYHQLSQNMNSPL
jgi:tetratricopeptide (TPR) repeat protein